MKITGLFLIMISIISCTIKERPIDYSNDDCAYCKMKLMDQRYGCEIVSSKGKIYTFDATECMIPFLQKNEFKFEETAFILITPYTNPGTLFEAKSAYFLRSAKLPSPMGAFLTAFADEKTATDFQIKNGGKIYSWNELFDNFQEIRALDLVKHD